MTSAFISLTLAIASIQTAAARNAGTPDCPSPWTCEKMPMTIEFRQFIPVPSPVLAPLIPVPLMLQDEVKIRAGYMEENPKVPFQGNIIYLEGLADSMMNHHSFFKKLTQRGYRVIAFDYMGQGRSTGSMNNTRIKNIRTLSQKVWEKFATKLDQVPTRTVIGWSTGGLAAYALGLHGLADRMVLIAPGLVPNAIVGEGLGSWPPNEITLESLTSDTYGPGNPDPHFDPISPKSPVLVPSFAANLLGTAQLVSRKKMDPKVRGLVFLGSDDSYVDSPRTREVLKEIAPHFLVHTYDGARHEIHNERQAIREGLMEDVLDFLDQK
ncbi:MAG: alpha/beta fold hydrolase [Bdellovibrionales bacterium]|nr:alpha/beta fold hydrolase [Bdellovibrionales bacterium]